MAIGGLAAGAAGGVGINIVIRAIDNFSKTFALAQTQVAGLGGFIRKHKAGILMAGAAITGATAMIASSSIKAFSTFQEQLINSMNMFDNVTDEMMGDAKELSLSLSKELGISANDAAEALFYFGSAGMDLTETMEAMPVALRFARANVLDMAEASDFTLTIMKVWGKETKDLPGILDRVTFAMKNAKLNMNMMAESFKYTAPVAADLNMRISETAVLTGVLADAGITGSMAGTVLRRSFLNLTSPTTKQKELMDELGISVFDSEGKFRGIMPVLEQFEEATKTMSDEQRSATLKTIFGARAVAGMSAILKRGTEELNKYIEEVEGADGAVGEMLSNMEKGAAFQMAQFRASVEELKISLGEALAPVLLKIVDVLKPMVEWFTELSTPMKAALIIIPMLTGVILMLAVAVALLATVSAPIWLIIGAIVLAIGALIAIGYLLVKNWDWIKEKAKMVYDFLKMWFAPQIAVVKIAIEALAIAFRWLWDHGLGWVWEKMKAFYNWVKDYWLGIFEKVISFIGRVAESRVAQGEAIETAGMGILGSKQLGGYIPRTGPYLLHKGEQIVPSHRATRGGVVIHIEGNIYGTDPDEMAEAFAEKVDDTIRL